MLELAGCDRLTIAPALLGQLRACSDLVEQKLSEAAAVATGWDGPKLDGRCQQLLLVVFLLLIVLILIWTSCSLMCSSSSSSSASTCSVLNSSSCSSSAYTPVPPPPTKTHLS